jgi:uncharacterized protein (TIGR02246 family)
MSFKGLVVGGAIAFLVACAMPEEAPDTSAEQQALAAVSEEWVEAFRASDLDRLLSLYADDARIMSQGQQRRVGKPEIREMFAQLFQGDAISAINFEIEEIGLMGAEYAWASVLAAIQGASPESITAGPYLSRTFILYRKDVAGNWLIFRDVDHATPDAAQVSVR